MTNGITEGSQEAGVVRVKDRRHIDMLGDHLLATRTEDGTIYLPVRALCESLGLDRAAQVRRIKRDEAMQEDLQEIPVDTDSGGMQTMQFLRLETVPYWLSGVSVNKVKPELREKLLAYKRWVVRKVYEAFVLEFGGEGQGQTLGTALSTSGQTSMSTLSHVRELGLALAKLAEEQMALERRQQFTSTEVEQLSVRMNRAATVVGQILERVNRLEERTSPAGKGAITTEQAAEISLAVKAIAGEMARRDQKESSPYQRVFTAMYQRYGIITYKQLPAERFADAMRWLQEWYESLLPSEDGTE